MKTITITIDEADTYVIKTALYMAAKARGTQDNKKLFADCNKRFKSAVEKAIN